MIEWPNYSSFVRTVARSARDAKIHSPEDYRIWGLDQSRHQRARATRQRARAARRSNRMVTSLISMAASMPPSMPPSRSTPRGETLARR